MSEIWTRHVELGQLFPKANVTGNLVLTQNLILTLTITSWVDDDYTATIGLKLGVLWIRGSGLDSEAESQATYACACRWGEFR